MEPQFSNKFTFRDGSVVEVKVGYEQGIAGKMDERKALERAQQILGDRLEELGEAEEV